MAYILTTVSFWFTEDYSNSLNLVVYLSACKQTKKFPSGVPQAQLLYPVFMHMDDYDENIKKHVEMYVDQHEHRSKCIKYSNLNMHQQTHYCIITIYKGHIKNFQVSPINRSCMHFLNNIIISTWNNLNQKSI